MSKETQVLHGCITYRDLVLQKAKDYYEKIKKREKSMREIDIRIWLKNKKIN